ncbi:MAG: hypothetical protein H6704_25605 [Myxococcales bacterium]|nr:hypothetical protein [Myxococcales bacterium]
MSAANRWALVACLAGAVIGCDGDGGGGAPRQQQPDGGALPRDTFETSLTLADGASVMAGPSAVCAGRFGDPSALQPAPPADWRAVYVDPAAAAGGDGSAGAPFAAVADALAAIGGDDAVLLLGPGRHAGPIAAGGNLAVVGACAAATIVEGAVTSAGAADGPRDRRLWVAGLTIEGGADNVSVQHLHRLYVRQARLLGAAGVGVRAIDVATADIADSWIGEAGSHHVYATEAAVAVRRSRVGPGPGAGIVVGTADGGAPDDGQACPAGSPVCPYGAMLLVHETLVQQVGGQGVAARYAQVVVRRSRVDGVGGDGSGGVVLARSFGVLDGGALVTAVAGTGVELSSARAHLDALRIEDVALGVRVRREGMPGEPGEVGKPATPGTWHPLCELMPAPDFAAVDGDAFADGDWATPADWFPELSTLGEGPLPPGLSADDDPIAEYDLHHWSRAQADALVVREARLGAVQISGHPMKLNDLVVEDVGADAFAFAAGATGRSPYDEAGADLAALSVVRRADFTGLAGAGLRIRNAGLFRKVNGSPQLLPFADNAVGDDAYLGAMQLTDVMVEGPVGMGVQIEDSVVRSTSLMLADAAGVGVRLQGAYLDANTLVVDGVAPFDLLDRDGEPLPGVADGFVLDGSETTQGAGTEGAVRVNTLSLVGAERVGLLVAQDRAALGASIDVAGGRIEGNARDGALLGPADLVQTQGIALDAVDVDTLDAPGLLDPPEP